MKRQLLVVAAMLGMVAVGCFQASAVPMPNMEPPEGPGGERPGLGPERDVALLVVALDPSDAQRERLREILDAERGGREEEMRTLRDGEMALRRMLDETTFDEAAFRTLADKVAKQQVELMIARAKMKSRLLAVLNPAQQAKAEQILRLTSPPPHGPGKPF